MRFVLDECIDARLKSVLTSHRHDCWRVPDTLLSADDDEVAVYAWNKRAVLVTDDRKRVRDWRDRLHGPVLEIKGPKIRACEVVDKHIDDIVRCLRAQHEIVVACSVHGAWITAPPHRATPAPTRHRKS